MHQIRESFLEEADFILTQILPKLSAQPGLVGFRYIHLGAGFAFKDFYLPIPSQALKWNLQSELTATLCLFPIEISLDCDLNCEDRHDRRFVDKVGGMGYGSSFNGVQRTNRSLTGRESLLSITETLSCVLSTTKIIKAQNFTAEVRD